MNTQDKTNQKGFGLASLIFGVIALGGLAVGLAPITGTLAVVLGILQIQKAPENRWMAITGIITGILGIIITMIVFYIVFKYTLPSSEEEILEIYNQIQQSVI